MNPRDRIWLLGAAAVAAATLALAVLAWLRWCDARRTMDAGAGLRTSAMAPTEASWSAIQARLDAGRSRLPAADSTASRQAQQAVLELVQRYGFELTEVMPRPEPDLRKAALPACPGWPAVVVELRGRASFPAVTAILSELPSLPTVVLPLDVELTRGAAGPARDIQGASEAQEAASAAADRRIQVRLVLAL